MKSKIWRLSSEEFKALVEQSESMVDLLKRVGLKPAGGNFVTVKNRLVQEGIIFVPTKHSKDVLAEILKNRKMNKKPLSEILIEHSTYSRYNLKRRLLSENLLENTCAECGISNNWNNKPLSLQLDHINGVSDDNRIENLRLLCPNCHSQTETFAGKNVFENEGIPKYACLQCGNACNVKSKSGLCRRCYEISRRLVERPPIEQIQSMIQEMGYEAVGRHFGVSGAAVRKWLK